MPIYNAPVDDVLFLLNDVFHIERHNNLAGFADATPDVVEAILVEAGKFCSEVLTPLNRTAISRDVRATPTAASPRRTDSRPPTTSSSPAAGSGSSSPAEYGGQGLPST